jgi:SAM-dependent methyltransferase
MSDSSGRLLRHEFARVPRLEGESVWDLACALLHRIERPEQVESYGAHQQHLSVFRALSDVLEQLLDVPGNRFSLAQQRAYFAFVERCMRHHNVPLRGAVYVDAGCGSANPYGRMFTHLMGGAKRGYCIDLDPVQNISAALKALARLASSVIVAPKSVFEFHPLTSREVFENIADFDLEKLARGTGGLSDRLQLLNRSAAETGLPDASVDVVVSNSFLEHVPDANAVIAEFARITKPGGFAMHGIDCRDHRWYGQPMIHEVEFLTVESSDPIVFESNRLRMMDFERCFADHGFTIIAANRDPCVSIPASVRERLVEPWSSQPDEVLGQLWAQFLLRKS